MAMWHYNSPHFNEQKYCVKCQKGEEIVFMNYEILIHQSNSSYNEHNIPLKELKRL
jgi:hypothetical protein